MNDLLAANSPILFLFLYLLPGFLGLLVYGFLVEGAPQDKFDRLVTAVVLSLISALCVHFLLGQPLVPVAAVTAATPANEVLQSLIDLNLLYCSVTSMLFAAIVAVLTNQGLIYGPINWLKVSYKTSSNDVWQDVFYRHRGYCVKLQFEDGRTLVGWPKFFSATNRPRELFIADATWSYRAEDGTFNSLDVAGPGVYVCDLGSISHIEILEGG